MSLIGVESSLSRPSISAIEENADEMDFDIWLIACAFFFISSNPISMDLPSNAFFTAAPNSPIEIPPSLSLTISSSTFFCVSSIDWPISLPKKTLKSSLDMSSKINLASLNLSSVSCSSFKISTLESSRILFCKNFNCSTVRLLIFCMASLYPLSTRESETKALASLFIRS